MRETVHEAVDNGHLDVVKHVLPWIYMDEDFHVDLDEACLNDRFEVIDIAARHGRLDTVRLFHTNNIPGCWKRAIESAAAGGHIDIVKWLQSCKHKRNFEFSNYRYHAIDFAAINGHFDIVKWLHENTDENAPLQRWIDLLRNNYSEIVL
ncbi:hypothetical protein PHMEG_00035724 [Phytophthora megakarya]|uniref:Uncharacterized protein n=1 Tax=Phytophthora megakarya TaxID=4795 RepID=A0A225UND7_9STRA|nr:hypothetical protein PHMEG_00035724 [Phytophthora megakarya]